MIQKNIVDFDDIDLTEDSEELAGQFEHHRFVAIPVRADACR